MHNNLFYNMFDIVNRGRHLSEYTQNVMFEIKTSWIL